MDFKIYHLCIVLPEDILKEVRSSHPYLHENIPHQNPQAVRTLLKIKCGIKGKLTTWKFSIDTWSLNLCSIKLWLLSLNINYPIRIYWLAAIREDLDFYQLAWFYKVYAVFDLRFRFFTSFLSHQRGFAFILTRVIRTVLNQYGRLTLSRVI